MLLETPYHPDAPEEDIPPFHPADLPAEEELDRVDPAEVISSRSSRSSPRVGENVSAPALPRLILGCATFGYGIYGDKADILSSLPVRIVRLALRAGVTAFDTSPWYHPSEQILGRALALLTQTHPEEFPRASYQIITKVGKYGPSRAGHTYAADVVEKSVMRSLRRLKTDYLDVVYLHDVEFRTSPTIPAGNPLPHLSSLTLSSLPPTSTPLAPGEAEILTGILALRSLQSRGLIRHIGIAGYPLPTLLHLSLLVLQRTGSPLDIVQSYAHHTLANTALAEGYLSALTHDARVGRVVSASPLAMGLLTRRGVPEWHPAKGTGVERAARQAVEMCEQDGKGVEDVACEFGYRAVWHRVGGEEGGEELPMPLVVGCKSLEELHASLKAFRLANEAAEEGGDEGRERRRKREELEERIKGVFDATGTRNWSYQSPATAPE